MPAPVLAVIDRGFPAAEQYRDLLYFCVGIRMQFGGMDLILRGPAVSCALETAALDGGDGSADKLPDPQRYLRTLLRTGTRIWADQADLAELGHTSQTLLDGVVLADTDALTGGWHEYEEVWYL